MVTHSDAVDAVLDILRQCDDVDAGKADMADVLARCAKFEQLSDNMRYAVIWDIERVLELDKLC